MNSQPPSRRASRRWRLPRPGGPRSASLLLLIVAMTSSTGTWQILSRTGTAESTATSVWLIRKDHLGPDTRTLLAMGRYLLEPEPSTQSAGLPSSNSLVVAMPTNAAMLTPKA